MTTTTYTPEAPEKETLSSATPVPSPAVNYVEAMRHASGGGIRRIADSAQLTLTHGIGSKIYDTHGNEYFDLATGMGVAGFGHSQPRIKKAIADQVDMLMTTPLLTSIAVKYQECLADILPPPLEQAALFSSGAEAVEAAVRLAQTATGKGTLIAFETAFHGNTAGVRFLGGRYTEERDVLKRENIDGLAYPLCRDHDAVSYASCTDGGADVLAQLAVVENDDVAGVIVEAVLGTAGNRPPERRFLAGLRELCDTRGWLLIFDESITGFGRLGTMFACQYFNVKPDILIMGKAMGGGFPVSAVAAPEAMWTSSVYRGLSASSSSYGGNPAACAAGMAVLDVIEAERIIDNVNRLAPIFAEGLRDIAARSDSVRDTRGVGVMVGFDVVDPQTSQPAERDQCLDVLRRCLDNGIFALSDVSNVRLYPPMNMSASEAHEVIERLGRVFI